jgi:hypothetical protein
MDVNEDRVAPWYGDGASVDLSGRRMEVTTATGWAVSRRRARSWSRMEGWSAARGTGAAGMVVVRHLVR